MWGRSAEEYDYFELQNEGENRNKKALDKGESYCENEIKIMKW
jgi:hypothetical protein